MKSANKLNYVAMKRRIFLFAVLLGVLSSTSAPGAEPQPLSVEWENALTVARATDNLKPGQRIVEKALAQA